MDINWIKPEEELPAVGDTVAVLCQHWKKEFPDSLEIFFGEVEAVDVLTGEGYRVQTNDYTGHGSWAIPLTSDQIDPPAIAWTSDYHGFLPMDIIRGS